MDELAGTENRIAVERMRYNERVQEYNTSRRQFPANITAAIFGSRTIPLFEAPESAKETPESGLFTAKAPLVGFATLRGVGPSNEATEPKRLDRG